MRNITTTLTTLILLTLSPSVFAASSEHQTMPADHSMHKMVAAEAEVVHQSTGIVKKWGEKTVVIAHDAIPALNWPAMTMAFDLPEKFAGKPLEKETAIAFTFREVGKSHQLISVTPVQK